MPPRDEGSLPAPCRLVSLVSAAEQQPVRIAAVVQQDTGPGNPPMLVLLGSSVLGRAYLGALADAHDRVLAWLELWVQTTGERPALGGEEAATNAEFDARWRQWIGALAGDPTVVTTGWEQARPHPIWLDAARSEAVEPRDSETGAAYELCTDDARLMAAGLEPFSSSARRFLAVPDRPAAGLLAGVGDVPVGAKPVSVALPGAGASLLPFNPEGGFILVRRLAPLGWEAYAGLLAGKAIRGLAAGQPAVRLGGPYAALDDWEKLQQSGAYVFGTARGRAGRFHETFHLKLLLLQSMLREVKARVAATQLPCLNLGASAFRVDLAPAADALPVLWTARAVLAGPPGAVAFTATGGLRYFRPSEPDARSIYRPEAADRSVRGRGELRIRKVHIDGGHAQVEATVVSPEIALASPRDLVSARLPLPGAGTITLIGTIDAAEALAHGEARFRTPPLECDPTVSRMLPALEGRVFPGTPFETLPRRSTPVDLFALGVLGVQLLLTGAGKPLPAVLDEVLSLGRAAAGIKSGGKPGERVRQVVVGDARWRETLGPQHHGHGATAEEAASFLPSELWWDAVATLSRFFPGTTDDAFCRDFGDAPPHQIEAAFVAPLAEVEALVLRSQSLLLCDWPANREIARVIQQVR